MKQLLADIIIKNGKVLTVNQTNDIVEAVAIRGDKILAVGSNADVDAYLGEGTRVIDAAGKTVLPGFIDAHIHVGMFGLLDHGVIDVAYPKVKSIADIQALIRADAAKKKPGEWIKLNGYDHNKLEEKRHPTKEELDAAAPNNPVQLTRCCAHMGVYNTLALEKAGVKSADQYAPDEVVLNEDGSLHGLLKETAHMDTSTKVEYSNEELVNGYANADQLLLSLGVTSAHDAGAYGAVSTRALQDACLSGAVKTRINAMIFDMFGKQSGIKYIDSFLATGIHSGCGNEHFRVGPVKIMLDGSSSGPSSAVIDGYTHEPDNHGIQVWTQEEADEMVMKAHLAGYQMTAHAVGDKAVTIMVNAIEKALAACPRPNRRHRIEHCGITNPELIERIAKLGIVPISNPAFISINASDYNRYYGSRVDYMFAMKSYLDKGIITAIGSDAPITYPNPMNSLFGALNRMDQKTRDLCGEMQKVNVLEAVRMFTYNGAYASFEENIKGSLEPGKLADVVVLDQDLLTYPVEKVQDVKVRYTLVGGEVAYTAD